MKTGDEKYRKIIKAVRHSEPDTFTLSEIEESILKSIAGKESASRHQQNIFDFLFGWIWIGWVRKGLITISVCLVAFFVVQQNSILNKIDRLQIRKNDRMITYNPYRNLKNKLLFNRISKKENIPEEITINRSEINYYPYRNLENKLLFNRISEKENIPEEITINRSDLNRLLDSLDRVQTRVRNIIEMIETDPALKKAVEQKLKKNALQGLNL